MAVNSGRLLLAASAEGGLCSGINIMLLSGDKSVVMCRTMAAVFSWGTITYR